MKICSRDFRLTFSRSTASAKFNIPDLYVEVGTKGNTQQEIFTSLIHEIEEAALSIMQKRYQPWFVEWTIDDFQKNYLFVFDHHDLTELCAHLAEALMTSGFVKLIDPRRKR